MPENFGTKEAIDEINDAMGNLKSPYNVGIAMGMVGMAYQAGLIDHNQFNSFTTRIIEEKVK